MLTLKQSRLLDYMDDKQKETGLIPSYSEMMDAMNLASKSGVHRLITGLEERGYIRRLPHRARAIEIIKRSNLPKPKSCCPHCGGKI